MTLRAAASMAWHWTPGCAAARAADWAWWTMSKTLLLLVGGFAEDEGAGDVGLVAFDGAAVVDEDDLAFADDLGLEAAVGEGGVLADLAGGIAGDAAAGVGGGDELAELAIGHAGLRGFLGGFVDGEGDVVGELHESELGGGLDGAAAEGDGGGADGGEGWGGVGDAVGEDELGALFDADLAGGDAGFLEGSGEERVGIFVFVPGVDAGCGGGGEGGGLGVHAFADAALFEGGTDDEGAAGCGEDPGEEALGLTPAEAGEVGEGGAGAMTRASMWLWCRRLRARSRRCSRSARVMGMASERRLVRAAMAGGRSVAQTVPRCLHRDALGAVCRAAAAAAATWLRRRRAGSCGVRACGDCTRRSSPHAR